MENKNQELTDRKHLESIERNLQSLKGKVDGCSSWDVKTLVLLVDFLSIRHNERLRTYTLKRLIENKEREQECFYLKRIADSIDNEIVCEDNEFIGGRERVEKKKRLKEVEEIEAKIMAFFENGGEESDEVCRHLKRIEKKIRQIVDVSTASVKARKEAREKEELLRKFKKG